MACKKTARAEKPARRKKKTGRKCKYNAEVHATIIKYIQGGAFDYEAAEAAGIGESTFRRWLASPERKFRSFRADVEKASAMARVVAGNKVWVKDPLSWLRLGPGRAKPGKPGWTESEKVELSGPDGGPIEYSELSPEQRKARLANLLAKRERSRGETSAGNLDG